MWETASNPTIRETLKVLVSISTSQFFKMRSSEGWTHKIQPMQLVDSLVVE